MRTLVEMFLSMAYDSLRWLRVPRSSVSPEPIRNGWPVPALINPVRDVTLARLRSSEARRRTLR